MISLRRDFWFILDEGEKRDGFTVSKPRLLKKRMLLTIRVKPSGGKNALVHTHV